MSGPPEGALWLLGRVDDLIEVALRERRTLEGAMALLLPVVAEHVGAEQVFVRTYGEDLDLHLFAYPPGISHRAVDAFLAANEANPLHGGVFPEGDRVLVGQGMDVAGEWFGAAGFLLPLSVATDETTPRLRGQLRVVCEQLDNYLFAIRQARVKHRLLTELARALQNRVLADGIAEAVGALAASTPFRRLAITLQADAAEGAAVHVLVFEGGRPVVDTLSGLGGDETLREAARTYLASSPGGAAPFLEKVGLGGGLAREEVLLHGVKETTVVGKIACTSPLGEFNTYDRELLMAFGQFICQRVVDFGKEYRTLARSFRPGDVDRMLRTADYVPRYLKPREKDVAILYADVSGFTRVCEQVLVDPERIGRLVDVWGARAVAALWEHGGVFDKMVGDCVIGMFGPPFYEGSAADQVGAALRAAQAIRDMTAKLPEDPEFALLRGEGLGVSTGINYAPLFVGTFGPNDNFTGFSAGMNNAARLQAQASKGEILVMESAVATLPLGSPFAFGDPREAKVKNVADPLRFRPLR